MKLTGTTAKQEYSLEDSSGMFKDLREIVGLDKIYHQYFSKHNCHNFLQVLNKWSRLDALVNSGDTTILIEYKRRNYYVYEFETMMLEKIKYDKMKEASLIFNAKACLVVEWRDAVLIHFIDFDKEYAWERMEAPIKYKSAITENKFITMLPNAEADIIIGKRTWERASKEKLLYYIKQKTK